MKNIWMRQMTNEIIKSFDEYHIYSVNKNFNMIKIKFIEKIYHLLSTDITICDSISIINFYIKTLEEIK